MRIACLWGLRVSGRQVRQELPALPVCLPQSQPQIELQLRLHGPPRRSSSFPARLLLKFSKIAWCERRLSFWYWINIISKVFNAKRTNCFKVKQEISANLYLRQYISTLTVYNANVSKLCIFLHYRVNMALRKIFVVFRFIHTEWKHMRRKTYFLMFVGILWSFLLSAGVNGPLVLVLNSSTERFLPLGIWFEVCRSVYRSVLTRVSTVGL